MPLNRSKVLLPLLSLNRLECPWLFLCTKRCEPYSHSLLFRHKEKTQMSVIKSLETSLDQLFVKSAPALPATWKKFLVSILPWANLIIGLFTLYSVYLLWHWAHAVSQVANYVNNINAIYGGPAVTSVDRLSATLWVGLVVLGIEAVLYLAAFPGTLSRKMSGWNLMFYAFLVNVVYGIVVMFTSYGGFTTFIGSLIGSAIGLYLLFQIKSLYSGAKTAS
jgi:hypothetical protein